MNQEAPPIDPDSQATPSHKDRRTGLIVFGIFQILLGLLCLGFAALIPVGQMLSAQATDQAMSLKMILPGILIYAFWGVAFLWLGFGSTLCRRWARALTLIYSWVWLAMGIFMVPMMIWLMPKIMSSAGAGGEIPENMIGTIIVTQIVFMAISFIVLPGILVLFYRSRHVKATCEARDPAPRWTDKCPLPLLALALLTWWSSLMMLCLSLSGMAMVPLFGTLLTGIPAAILMVAVAGFFFWIGWSFYRLKIAGWWAFLGMAIVFTISNVLTWSKVDVMKIYEYMDYPEDQMELLRQQDWMSNSFFLWSCVAWVIPMLIYLFWVKRFFRSATPSEESA